MRRTISLRLGFVAVSALGLTACGSRGDDPANAIGNLFAYQSTKAPPVERARKAKDVVCPIVQVADGQSAYRTYGGADRSNASVKQQFSLGDLSRDCTADDDRLSFRIGISGYVQEGPVGGPGSFTVPVKVLVRRESDLQPAAVKTFRVAATIPAGETSSPFSFVTEPIVVPFLSEQADDDYAIYVGFDQGAPEKPVKTARRKRARR